MTDVAPEDLTGGDRNLEIIQESGVELTSGFVAAFRAMSPEQQNIWVEDARRNILATEFGWAASFIFDEEIGPILRQAVDEGWTEQKLFTSLRNTNWFKSRTDKQRQWDQQIALDPKSKEDDIAQRSIDIQEVVAQYGETLAPEQVRELAIESLRSGWTEQQMFRGIASEAMKNPASGGGVRFGIVGRGIRELASKFAVPISEQTADEWASKVASGQVVQADYENWLRSQAKGLYPSLAAEIDRGLDVKTLTDPFAQVAQSTLGITAEQINFADPKWNAALNFDDGKGRRMMTLYEWGRHLRTEEQYGYDRTPEATNKAYEMVDRLGRMFGVTA